MSQRDHDPRHPGPKALDTRRPFTWGEALASGISRRDLRSGQYRRLFAKTYVASEVRLDHETWTDAALLLHPESAFASHSTAARLYGVVVPDSSLVHVSVFRDVDRRWAPGIKPHVAPSHTRVVVHRGRRVSNAARMFIELAAILDLVDLVVAGDSMLRVFGITAEQLRSSLALSTDYWSSAARYAAQFVRDRVESPMESRLRMLIVLAGLPEPEVNPTIRDHAGEPLLRFDLLYRKRRLAVEYAGRHHLDDHATWESDVLRQDKNVELRFRVLTVTQRGIYVDPAETLHRVWRALCSTGPQVARPNDVWRKHFPGRRLAG